jgi:hypothetical protein
MLPSNYHYAVDSKRQEFEREMRQRALVRQVERSRLFQRDVLMHLGRWLVACGEYLEARYGHYRQPTTPAPSTVNPY